MPREHDAQFRILVFHVVLVAVAVLINIVGIGPGKFGTNLLYFLLETRGARRAEQVFEKCVGFFAHGGLSLR